MDMIFLQILVTIDILLQLIVMYFDHEKPSPLSSMEFHFFMQDFKDLMNEIANENSKERRKELVQSELRMLDRFKNLESRKDSSRRSKK